MAPERPDLSWSGLRGALVGVWGLGVEGLANVRKLATLGVDPVLVDDRPRRPGPDGRAVLATAEGGLEALGGCDVVIKSPGISRYRPEVAELTGRGIPVAGGLGLWLAEADRGRVACITGTKGKSSTTAIAGHLLRRWGYPCVVGGNIGQPPWDPSLDEGARYWVIETSSYQATDLAVSPAVVAVTSLHPDHLEPVCQRREARRGPGQRALVGGLRDPERPQAGARDQGVTPAVRAEQAERDHPAGVRVVAGPDPLHPGAERRGPLRQFRAVPVRDGELRAGLRARRQLVAVVRLHVAVPVQVVGMQ